MFFTCYTSFASNSGLFQRSVLTARVTETLRSCRRRLLAGTYPIRCSSLTTPSHHSLSVRALLKRLQKCGREFPFSIFSSRHPSSDLHSPGARMTLSKSTCGRSARRHGNWRMATHPSRTCRTRGLSSATSSRLCASRRPYHDPFTISCIYVLSPSLQDRTQTSCSTCVPPLPFFISIDPPPAHLRLISYGLLALARRLFGCWASVKQSTRNSYFARMTTSIRKIQKFLFFLSGHSLLSFFLYISLSPSSLRSHYSLSVFLV